MAQFDEPLDALRRRRPSSDEPADLDEFWSDALTEARSRRKPTSVHAVDVGLPLIDVYDLEFSGFGGEPIRAWYRRPAGTTDRLPIVINHPGYGGDRGLAHQVGPWPLAGYAELNVDVRGQGASGGPFGSRTDQGLAGPATTGFMTRGIQSPADYYYRRVMVDSVLAVDAASELPDVDSDAIVLDGTSQGGGLTLAAAALATNVAAVMVNVPFLCDFPRSVAVATTGPFTEISAFLASQRSMEDTTFRTLRYFDPALLVSRATAPAFFSVALADTTCPPSGVYAAYNNYAGPKEIRVYPYNGHEGGQFHHQAEQLRWLRTVLTSLPNPQLSSSATSLTPEGI